MQRRHTVHVFRDLPDLIYRMLAQVSSLKQRIEAEISAMKDFELRPADAHHLMVEAVRGRVLPAAWLPRVLHEWEEPRHEEFRGRTAWSLMNAFTEIAKHRSPRQQMEESLRLSSLFRRELSLS